MTDAEREALKNALDGLSTRLIKRKAELRKYLDSEDDWEVGHLAGYEDAVRDIGRWRSQMGLV